MTFLEDLEADCPRWKSFSHQRLAHYIYTLQNRRSTAADKEAVWAYLDALRDNCLISTKQKNQLLALANVVHENLLTHCEPYTKIPWQTIVETIESIAKGQIHEKERET